MLHYGRLVLDVHIGEGMCSAMAAQQQRVALAVVACTIGTLTHLHESAV